MKFRRTLSGIKAKHHFYSEIIVWVEGPTDVAAIKKLLAGLPCRVEDAGGIEECTKLANELMTKNQPYVVVCDGHYQILIRSRSPHRRLIYLQRHSIENYFFEANIIERVCLGYVSMKGGKKAKLRENEMVSAAYYNEASKFVQNNLKQLIVYDVANHIGNNGKAVLPSHCNILLNRDEFRINTTTTTPILTECESSLDEQDIEKAAILIQKFIDKGSRLVDILKGHIVFGIIRLIIQKSISRKIGHMPKIDNIILEMLLINEVWSNRTTVEKDHINLERRVRKAVREVVKLKTGAK